jgi:hypothetical protein
VSGSSESLTYSNLNQSYQFSSGSAGDVSDVAPVEEPAPLLDGAKNILQFIEHGLASEKASGASSEELSELLQEGLKGFKQGFAEAEDILQGNGELNDVVTGAIGTLYQQVVDGFAALEEQYVRGDENKALPIDPLAPIPSERGRGPEDATGVDPSRLTLQQPSDVSLSFISESAAYSNSVGYYLIGENGLLSNVDLIWENGNETEEGNTVTLEDVPAGEIGFFIIPNGYSRYENIIDEAAQGNGVLRFEDDDGNISSSDDTGSVLVYYSEGTQDNPAGERTELNNVYHASYANLNADGFAHARSGASVTNDNALTIGFEDLPGARSDWDLQDFVFDVSIDNAAAIPTNVAAPQAFSSVSVSESVSISSISSSVAANGSSTAVGGRQAFSSSNGLFESYGEQFKAITSGTRTTLSSASEEAASTASQAEPSVGEVIAPENLVNAQVEYGRKDRFSFELTTLDGDNISINASNTSVYYGEYQSGEQTNSSFVEGLKDKSGFAIDVVGELDEDEVRAIEDLLDQIMSLSDEFYNGDIYKAYEAALDLGYDQNEIASYALRLHQVEQYKVAASYQDFAPEADQLNSGNNDIFSAIGDYARSVLDSLNNPVNYNFFDYSQLLSGISEEIDRQIKPESGSSFSEVMADFLERANVKGDFDSTANA